MQNFVNCDVCKKPISAKSYQSHLLGKKHKEMQEILTRRRHIEETGLYIKGVPIGVSAAEVTATFGSYGPIAKVEIYGKTALVNYTDMSFRDNALNFNHIIRNQVLEVHRRVIQSEPTTSSENPLKRNHDGSHGKFSHKREKPTMPYKGQNQVVPVIKKAIDNGAVLSALADQASILEQVSKLKEVVLADNQHCNYIQEHICKDLRNTLQSAFKVCELYAFGSTTTGLAFKDSDLDVYAHLEFNPTTHQVSSDSKKVFATAKSCMYRRQDLFSNIIPIQRAKTPIIKILHVRTQTSCDLSFRDAIGYCNSRLLRHYLNMNERFFDLVFFIKYWACAHKLNSPSKLSNFSLCMLGISFLMSLRDSMGNKILPSVHELIKNADPLSPLYCIQGWKCGFDETPITVTMPDTPEFSLIGLFKNFLEYIVKLPFQTHVISLLTGELISRQMFEQNPCDLPDAYDCYKCHVAQHPIEVLCKPEHSAVIHDPFRLNHNLLGRVNSTNMQEFILACTITVKKCEEALNNTEKESSLFLQLLSPDLLAGVACTGKVEVCRSTNKTVSVIMEQPFMNSTQVLQKVKDLLYSIFKRILFLKTVVSEKESLEEPRAKISKVDSMENVLGSNRHPAQDNQVVLLCEGEQNVWSGRKKAKTSLDLKNPLSFQDEEMISEFLSKQNSTVSNVKFQCQVIVKDRKLHLKFQEVSEKKDGNFNCFMSFVNHQLPKWISYYSSVSLLLLDSLTKEQQQCSSSAM